jgi:hypothetical protein
LASRLKAPFLFPLVADRSLFEEHSWTGERRIRVPVRERFRLEDTFDAFLRWWQEAREQDLTRQVLGWHDHYMAAYPELRRKQVQDYSEDRFDWRAVAQQQVFPHLPRWLPAMKQTRANLLWVVPEVCERMERTLGVGLVPSIVLYVGIACGAGWATRYLDEPACLLGLEMIAQSGWQAPDRLEGLLAHELGHLAHMDWRGEWDEFERAEDDPCFQLYSEGFAQRCEQIILGRESWHQVQDDAWLRWCRSRLPWLAKRYLQRVVKEQPVREFFGSWHALRGRRQTGYFLGHAWVGEMLRVEGIQPVARLSPEEVRQRCVAWLRRQAAS